VKSIPDGQGLRRLAIIGGGISGMAAAYTVQEAARQQGQKLSVTLIESGQRLGGKIVTEQAGDFTIEGGPDCFIRQKPWASQLIRKIGLQSEVIGTNDYQRKTYVVDRGRLVPLPDGVMLIVPTRVMPFALTPLISLPGKIRMGWDLFVPSFKGEQDESIGDFVRRRLGAEALDKIAEPLLSGIHVSDPECQSLLATFPRFRALEQKHGSLIQGMLAERRERARAAAAHQPAPTAGPASMFLSLRGGLGQLVGQLARSLTGVEVRSGQPATRLERLPEGGFRVYLNGQAPVTADAVILATPAYEAARLCAPFAPDLESQLREIRYVSTATVSLGFRKADIRRPFQGFGFVIPRKENREISACTWTSFKFDYRAPQEAVLLRCFMGGPGKEEQVALSDEEMLGAARRELARLMGLRAEPVVARIFRWEKANPQYDVDHLARVRRMMETSRQIPGLLLTGSAYEGVGVPDCIRQGQQAAENAAAYLQALN